MKTFSDYIKEAIDFRLGGKANKGLKYNYFPKDDEELIELIEKLIKERGGDGDFNDIDTSKVTAMYNMFNGLVNFNGDISGWDTSNVTNMSWMFTDAKSFNQDISGWDTGNVTDMYMMFYYAYSFNQDISSWETGNVTDSRSMFSGCPIKEEYKPHFKK